MHNKIIINSHRAYSSREQAHLIRQEAKVLLEQANEFSTTSRRVNRRSAYKVLARSLEKTRGLPFSIRKHQALTELSNYISLAKYNKVVGLEAFNTDLLPVSHPRSTRMNSMTASAIAEAQMRWILDDPRIKDESVKSLLASAMFSPIDSPEHKYSMIRLENLPQGQVPVEVLLAAANPFAGKNSAAARRAREALQLSDRFERWINMGRSLDKRATDGFRVFVKRNDGSTKSLSGELLNQNMFDPNLVDIEMGKGKVATVPTKLGEGLEAFIKSKDSEDGYSPVEADVPSGAQVLPEDSIVVSDAPSIYRKDDGSRYPNSIKYTDDKYDIIKFDNPKAAQTAIADGQSRAAELDKPEPKLLKKGEVDPDSGKQFWDIEEPVYGVYRRGKNTPLAFAQSWKDVNNEILRDEPNLDEDEGRDYTRPEPRTSDDTVPLLDQADDIFKPTKKKADKKKEVSSFPYEVPERAYEFNPNEEYTPEFEFDDPVTIANDQMSEELEDALVTAVEPVSDTEKATGYAPISFTDGREHDVPAEAIAAAIREQGGDAEMALARAYDKIAGNNNNEKALLESRGDKDPVLEGVETVEDEEPISDTEPGLEPVSPSDKILEDEVQKPDTKETPDKTPVSEEEPIADIVDETEDAYIPPLLEGLTEEELAKYKEDGDYRPFLPKNKDIDTPEGLYKLDPNPVDPATNYSPKELQEEYPSVTPKDLSTLPAKTLTSDLESAINGTSKHGPGFGELLFDDPNMEEVNVPIPAEALRDALQLKGKDTDAIIEKINKKAAKAKPKAPVEPKKPSIKGKDPLKLDDPHKPEDWIEADGPLADFLNSNENFTRLDGLGALTEIDSPLYREYQANSDTLKEVTGNDYGDEVEAIDEGTYEAGPSGKVEYGLKILNEAGWSSRATHEKLATNKGKISALNDAKEIFLDALNDLKTDKMETNAINSVVKSIDKEIKKLEKEQAKADKEEEEKNRKKVVEYKRAGNRTLLRGKAGAPFKDPDIANFLDENGFEWTPTYETSEGEKRAVNAETAIQTDEEFKAFARELRDRFDIDLQPRAETPLSPAQEPIDFDEPAKEGEKVSEGTPPTVPPTPPTPSSEEPEKPKYTKKRPQDLKPGDEVYIPGVGWRIVTSVSERKFDDKDQPSIWTVEYTDGNPYYPKTGSWKTRKDWLNDDGTEVDQTLFTRDPLGIPGDETPTGQQVVIQTEAPEGVEKPKAETKEETPTPEEKPTTQAVPNEIASLPAGTRAISKNLEGRKDVWLKQEDGSWVNIKTGEIVDELPTPVKQYGGDWWSDYEFTRPENLGGEEVADDDDSDLVDEVIIDSVLDEEKPAPTVDDMVDRIQKRRKLTRAERKALKKEKKHRQQMLIKIIDSNFGPGSFDLDFADRKAVKAMLFDLDSMTTEELEDISRAVNADLGWEFIKNLPDKKSEPEQEEKPVDLSNDKKKVLRELVAERRKIQDAIDEADLSDEVKPEEKKALKDALDELTRRIDEIVLSTPDKTPAEEAPESEKPEAPKGEILSVRAPDLQPGDVIKSEHFTIVRVETGLTKDRDMDTVPATRLVGYYPNSVEQNTKIWADDIEVDVYRGVTPPEMGDLPVLSKPEMKSFSSTGKLEIIGTFKRKDGSEGKKWGLKNPADKERYDAALAEYKKEFDRRYALWQAPEVGRAESKAEKPTDKPTPSKSYVDNIPASKIQVGDIAFRKNKFGAREFFTVTKVVGTKDDVTTIEGHYVGHQTQTKEWRSSTPIDVIRGETNLPKAGDKEPLDRPDKSLPNYTQLEKERQAKIAEADKGYTFDGEPIAPKVSKPKLPPFYGSAELLLDENSDGASIQKALDEKGFIVFDFETLGNDVQNVMNPDAPIQAAAVKYVDGKKVDELNIYINPGQPLGDYYYETDEADNRVLRANRMRDAEGNPITDEWLSTQPDLKEQLQKLVDFFGDNPTLVGQNIDFDLNILQRWSQKLGIEFNLTSAVDTLGIAKVLQKIERSTVEFPKNPKEGDQAFSSAGNAWTWTLDSSGRGRWAAPSNSLTELAKRLGVEVSSDDFHNALFDVEVTEKVLRKLLENVKAGDLPTGGTVAYANEFKKWLKSLVKEKDNKAKNETDKIVSDPENADIDASINEVKTVEEENVTIVDGEESSDTPYVHISPLYKDTINEDWINDPENTDLIPNAKIKDLKVGDFFMGSDGDMYEVTAFEDDEAQPGNAVRVIRTNVNTGQTLDNRKSKREDGGTGWFFTGEISGGIYRRKENADKTNAQISTETTEAIEDVEPILIPEERPVKGEDVTPEQAETIVNDAIDVITTSKPDSSIEEAVKGLNVDETVKEQVVAEPEVSPTGLPGRGSPLHISADGVTGLKPGDKVIHTKTKRVGFVSVLLDKYNKKYTNYVKIRYEDSGEREPVASKNLTIIYAAPDAGSVGKPTVDEKSLAEVTQKIRDARTDASVEYDKTPEELAQQIVEAQTARDEKAKEVNFVKTSTDVIDSLKENLPARGSTLNSVPSIKTGNLVEVNFVFDKPNAKELDRDSKELNLDSEDDLLVFRAAKDKFLRNQPIATIKPDGSIIWKREDDKLTFSLDLQKVLEDFGSPITNLSAMAIMPEPEDMEGTDDDNYGNGTLLGESESTFDYNNISKFPPTKEQRTVVDAIMRGKDVVVQALAGSGKTSTLVLAAKRILAERPDSKLLYIVFNKETAEEAQGRMPANVDSRTMDNIVYSMLSEDYKGRNKLNDANKIGSRSLIDYTDFVNLFDYYKFEPVTLMIRGTETTLGRRELVEELRDVVNRFAISGDETLTEKHFKRPTPYFDSVPKVMLDYAKRMWDDLSTEAGWDPTSPNLSRIDYSHMLKAWALTKPQFADGLNSGSTSNKPFKDRKNDMFFFDEAQDMNPVIVKLLADQENIQKVYVGDSNQAIYAFRGAVDELNNVKDAEELYLTQTFRFGQTIAGLGNRFLSTLGSKKKILGKPGEDDGELVSNMQDPNAIIARTNGGVIDAVFDMLAKGKTPGLNLETYYKVLSYARSAQYLMAANKGTPGWKKPKMHEDLAGFSNWNEVLKAVQDGKSVGGAMFMVRLLRDRRMSIKDIIDKLNSITPIRGTGFRTDEYVPLGMDAVKVGTTGVLGEGRLNSGYKGKLTYTVKDGLIEFENARSYQDFLLKNSISVEREYTKKNGEKGTYRVPAVAFEKGQEEEMLNLINDVRRWVQNYAPRIPIDSEVITAHKSKGKEWDRVLLWDDYKEPEVNDDGEMELPDPEERRISYVAVTRAKKAIDMGDSLKWIFEFTSDDDEKPETTEIEEIIGMSVDAAPEPVTPEEIGNEVVKAKKITDQKTLEVANRLIELMEQGVVPWTKGWSGGGFLPTNGKTNKSYQGTNTLALWAAMHLNDWTDPRFLTFNQGKALGGYVRKGETGTKILKPNVVTREVKQPDGSIKKEGYIYFTEVSVFNVAQFEKLNLPPLVKKDPVPVLDIETKILESYKDHPEIIYRLQDKAYYLPSEDKIYLPLREQFDNSNTFIETLFHELGHSTGHISRLGKNGKRKDLQDNYGNHKASRGEEELIAEITVALIAAEFGIEIDWGNTASYTKGWLKPLKDDPGMIIVAAKQAQDAVNWMLGIKPEDLNNPDKPSEVGEGVGSEGQTGEEIAEQKPTSPEPTPEPNVGEQGQTGEEIAKKLPKNKDTSVEPTKFTFGDEEYDLWNDITYDRESERGVDSESLESAHGIFARRILDGQELITDRNEINNYIAEILNKYGYGNKFFMLASGAVSDKSLGKDPMKGDGAGIEAGVGRSNSSTIPEGNPLKNIEFPIFLARSRGISKVAMLHEIAHLMEAGWRSGVGGGHNQIWHQTFLTLLRQEGFQKEANLLALTIGELKGDTGAINP